MTPYSDFKTKYELSPVKDALFYSTVKWLRLALGNKKDLRIFARVLHIINGNTLVATNGARLHAATFFDPSVRSRLVDGVYNFEPIKGSKILLRSTYISYEQEEKDLEAFYAALPSLLQNPEYANSFPLKVSNSHSDNLYRLICNLGLVKKENRVYTFDPSFLSDAMVKADAYTFLNPHAPFVLLESEIEMSENENTGDDSDLLKSPVNEPPTPSSPVFYQALIAGIQAVPSPE